MAPARNPTSWDEYHGRPSPTGSVTSSVLAREQAVDDDDDDDDASEHDHDRGFMARRRSSVTNHLAAIADIGGVNSFRSFARSWQRAAGFPEVIPRRPSFVLAGEQDGEQQQQHIQYGRSHVEGTSQSQTGLLRQHLEASSSSTQQPNGEPSSSLGSSPRLIRDDGESKPLLDVEAAGALHVGSFSSRSSIFAVPPHLAAPDIVGSYGSFRSTSPYGAVDGSMRHRISFSEGSGWGVADEEGPVEDAAHGEHQPILIKEVKQGDKVVLAVEGQSTLPQSVFNSINAIIGVGLLSLPLALQISGWIPGLIILTLTAAVTSHTGKLLAKCMDYDATLITYSDLAYVSFGPRARVVVSALFTLELVGACVALVILFADSLDLLLPGLATVNTWKLIAAGLVLVLNALPLRLFELYQHRRHHVDILQFVVIVIIDGLYKPNYPGSLREPATTYLLPENWLALPLAYGLLASPWGAHSVFPSIYRDMRHPYKWGKAVNITFSFSYVLDTCLAVIGLLMFGDGIKDAITSNILKTAGYPEGMSIVMCIFIAIIPLTKIPLNARPIITTMDVLCGVHEHHHHHHHEHSHSQSSRTSPFITQSIRGIVRVFVVLLLLFISIVFPAFDSVCAFLGAALCTLISIILPISFHLKLFWDDVSAREKVISGVFHLIGAD
ncbi:hypothetical protein CEP52_012001 [Fusarium oligoseptatum]|uniref:Amino acid transporter transmembrane domain-containing protein n=1 Tax=Fusarium oligoseptatum TaxID=2604345 RepID=A0A428T0L5_9HYPO|nr:hypothetical protein CEP52_012001 [Fusarium oligoseptatum]